MAGGVRVCAGALFGATLLVGWVVSTEPTTALQPDLGDKSNVSLAVVDGHDGPVLSRAKRYVVFPRGSSLQLVYCLSVVGYIPLTSIFVVGFTLGLAWMLPSETRQIYLQRRDTEQHPDREHRLKLYKDMEIFLNARGQRGQQCVLRTICDSTRPDSEAQRAGLMEELFKVLFSLPEGGQQPSEWDSARFNGTACAARFPDCTHIIDIPLHPNQ